MFKVLNAAVPFALGAVVIVSGRPASEVVTLAGLPADSLVRVLGHYGLQRWRAGVLETPPPVAGIAAARPRLAEIVAAAEPGVSLEDKTHSLAVHTRGTADPERALAALRPALGRLADELGLIRDPAERLGLLLGQIWRSVRIVADIGLHTGRPVPPNALVTETDWTPELARRMLVEFALVEPTLAGFEVDRYLGWPAQALAFKIGARLWAQARAEREAELGEAFSLRAFHRDALALGPMGLEPLRALLADGAAAS